MLPQALGINHPTLKGETPLIKLTRLYRPEESATTEEVTVQKPIENEEPNSEVDFKEEDIKPNNKQPTEKSISNSKYFEIAKRMIERGADINFTNQKGKTCLMYACKSGSFSVVKFLLINNANPWIKDK
jgi:ankyrin repeat protein